MLPRDPGVPGSKPGDWICPGCNDLQFARNPVCRQCRTPRPAGAGGQNTFGEAGDWICSVCGDLQFRRNTECRKCGNTNKDSSTSADATIAAQQQAAVEAQAIQAALIAQAAEGGCMDPTAMAATDEASQTLYLEQLKAMYAMGGVEGMSVFGGGMEAAAKPDVKAQLEDLRLQLARAKGNEEDLRRFNKKLDEKIEDLENQVALTRGIAALQPDASQDPLGAQLAATQAQVQAQAQEIRALYYKQAKQQMLLPEGGADTADVPVGHLVVEADKMFFLDSKTSQLFEVPAKGPETQEFLKCFPKAVHAARQASTSTKPVKQHDRSAVPARGGDSAERLMRTVRLTNLPPKVDSSVIMKSMGKAFGEVACFNVEVDPQTKQSFATVEFRESFAGIKASRAKQLGPITIAPSPACVRQEEGRGRSRSRGRR
ncbi:unnamed protein product [Prorocentrum cordatum]|uniref:RanBP2-type domain-containing protein n=1 Tax=Prorocentrum cordatum TaxID=2364126 RepID=A0ABN9QS30_9DINO|nr:unnamed protein product [Polarella glacialis]